MNPLTNVRNIQKLNQTELQLGTIGKKSWHDQYKESAWIFVGGLPYDLTEGDILCVFSQYGEIVNMNLVRDKQTGKSKGYGFICYEDQRSTVLAVDNLNSIKLLGRVIRVDHVESYKVPKEHGDEDEITKKLRDEGCAPKIDESSSSENEEVYEVTIKKMKKEKNPDKKKKKKKKKEKRKKDVSSDSSHSEGEHQPVKIKQEKTESVRSRADDRNRLCDNDSPVRGETRREGNGAGMDRSREGDRRNDSGRDRERFRDERSNSNHRQERGDFRERNFSENRERDRRGDRARDDTRNDRDDRRYDRRNDRDDRRNDRYDRRHDRDDRRNDRDRHDDRYR